MLSIITISSVPLCLLVFLSLFNQGVITLSSRSLLLFPVLSSSHWLCHVDPISLVSLDPMLASYVLVLTVCFWDYCHNIQIDASAIYFPFLKTVHYVVIRVLCSFVLFSWNTEINRLVFSRPFSSSCCLWYTSIIPKCSWHHPLQWYSAVFSRFFSH